VCVRATARLAPRLTRIDLDTGRQLDLATPNTELDLGSDLRVEPLAWTTPEGDAMSGVLLTPATTPTGRLPLFITYYSCEGYLRGGVGDEWPLAALASSGVATACINQAPRRAGETPQSQDATRDSRQALAAVASLITRLDARGLIDQGRVGMGGLSFGSEQTLWIATHSDLLAAASIASGQLEPVYYWMNGAPGRDVGATLKAIWGLGPPDQTPQAWARMSSALNTQHLKAPLLMQLPEQEYRYVPELYARLAATKTPVELYAFAGEPHIKVQPRHRLAVYQRNLDWFRFWLLCEEDPEPAKQAQYARWRTLRERSR
jgi:dipeptidyl aminopeptidase/acylaminoacyl peptidase